MNNLAEYSVTNIYDSFKPEEICFIVAKCYEAIEYDDYYFITDDLYEAVEYAHENEWQIFIYYKKLTKDCINADHLFRDLIDNAEEEGLDGSYFLDCLGDDGEKEFKEMIEKWVSKFLGDTWIADECVGELKE